MGGILCMYSYVCSNRVGLVHTSYIRAGIHLGLITTTALMMMRICAAHLCTVTIMEYGKLFISAQILRRFSGTEHGAAAPRPKETNKNGCVVAHVVDDGLFIYYHITMEKQGGGWIGKKTKNNSARLASRVCRWPCARHIVAPASSSSRPRKTKGLHTTPSTHSQRSAVVAGCHIFLSEKHQDGRTSIHTEALFSGCEQKC